MGAVSDLIRRARETTRGCLSVAGNWIYPGWACCRCDYVNQEGRERCKDCGHTRCPEVFARDNTEVG